MENTENVFLRNGMLIALLAPLGFRSEWGSLLAYLKIMAGTTLKIERSDLAFLDARRNILGLHRDGDVNAPGRSRAVG